MPGDTPPSRRATASDVARLAGTSQSAVSRSFNDGASVSPALRKRVMEAALELGYRPNAIARSLTTRRSRIVAVAMSYMSNQFYPGVLEALSNRLQDQGYQILLFTPSKSADPVFEKVMQYQVDAVILASTALSSAFARECRQAGVPVVMFNRTTDDPDVSGVTGDNERGARRIAAFLADGGHKRMAYIAGLQESSTSRDRERGFRQGLAERGLPEPLYAVGKYTLEGAATATRELLSRSDRPDAIFCANDHMALACMEIARHEFGLRISEDLSVVGFDDVGPARWPSFGLTSFSQPLEPMVDATIAMVTDFLEKPDQPARFTVIGGRLVIRKSARLPPGVVASKQVWTDV